MRDIENYTEQYREKSFEDYLVEYRRKKIIEIIKKHNPTTFLEIGCGLEPLFKYMDMSNIYSYTIIEPSEAFAENALKIARKLNLDKVRVINDFFPPQESLKEYFFDMIICSSLLHEVEDPSFLLKGIHETCCENTIVHVNVPNARSFHRLLAKHMGIIKDIYENNMCILICW